MATRKELVEAVGQKYRGAVDRAAKAAILNEFVRLTGYHRKHAIRVLRRGSGLDRPAVARNRVYDEAFRRALIVLWEAGDRVCGKRLKALLPILMEAMERHGHLDLDSALKAKLLQARASPRPGRSALTPEIVSSKIRAQPTEVPCK